MDDMGTADRDLFLNGEDEYDPEGLRRPGVVPDPFEYERSEVAYHNMEVCDNQDGTATVHHVTNDDDDDGVPDGKVESWEAHWPSPEAALKNTGKSRRGASGVQVNVYYNGVRVED